MVRDCIRKRLLNEQLCSVIVFFICRYNIPLPSHAIPTRGGNKYG